MHIHMHVYIHVYIYIYTYISHNMLELLNQVGRFRASVRRVREYGLILEWRLVLCERFSCSEFKIASTTCKDVAHVGPRTLGLCVHSLSRVYP